MPDNPILSINTADFTDPKIDITSSNENELRKLASILNLDFGSSRFRKFSSGIYEARPIVTIKRYPVMNLRNKRDKKYKYLKDFTTSDKFYSYFGKKVKAKIIYDDYSVIRAKVLFDYFHLWESEIRLSIAKNSRDIIRINQYIKDEQPKIKYQGDRPDHRLACFELSDFIDFAMSLKSDMIPEKKTMINKSTAKYIREVRNASFHFRVVTPLEYKQVFNFIYVNQQMRNLETMMELFDTLKDIEFGQ